KPRSRDLANRRRLRDRHARPQYAQPWRDVERPRTDQHARTPCPDRRPAADQFGGRAHHSARGHSSALIASHRTWTDLIGSRYWPRTVLSTELRRSSAASPLLVPRPRMSSNVVLPRVTASSDGRRCGGRLTPPPPPPGRLPPKMSRKISPI